MGNKDEALRPDFSIRPFLKAETDVDIKVLTKEEEILAKGSQDLFWQTLKKHFDNALVQLDQINEKAIEIGAPREQIGENTIVISMVKGVLRKIVNIVEDAKEAQGGGARK